MTALPKLLAALCLLVWLPAGRACSMPGLTLPATFGVYAAGAYAGKPLAFQLDQSGHQATQIDVTVHHPEQPVVLMLGAYEPTIWNLSWSEPSRILAVLVSGYHRQVVAGLPADIPVLVSTHDNGAACGYFYITPERLDGLNPLSRRLFGKAVDLVYPAERGAVLVGQSVPPDTRLRTSSATPPASFRDPSAPLAGPAGLADASSRGILRRATPADAAAWSAQATVHGAPSDVPPVAGASAAPAPKLRLYNAYVVLQPFTYPAGLYGAHAASFFIPHNVPAPTGNPGHSTVYDFNTLQCKGPMCQQR